MKQKSMVKRSLISTLLVAVALYLLGLPFDDANAGPPEPIPSPAVDIRTRLQPYQTPNVDPSQYDGRLLKEAPLPSEVGEPSVGALDEKTFYATADATVLQGYPTQNFGDTIDMWAGYDEYLEPDGKVARSLVKFDIASLPPNQDITKATLWVHLIGSWDYPDAIRRIRTYRITSGWSESSVTWNNRPGYGGAYGWEDIAHGDWDWYGFDVTNLVRAWYNGMYTNYGIMLRGPEVSGYDASWRAFGTMESDYTPELVIEHTPKGNPVTVTIEDGNGSPGSADNPVTISADNQSQNTTPIGAAEFWVVYDGSAGLTLADANTTARSSGFNVDLTLDESTPSAVEAHILLYSGGGATIASGTGPILELLFDVDVSAQPEDSSLLFFSNVLLSDKLANPIPTDFSDTGQFTFGCAKDGDINNDGNVNIFDLQILINMILHSPQPDSSLYPSDWWCRGDLAPPPSGDGRWNVFDLQRLICLILGTCRSGAGQSTRSSGENIVSIGEVYAEPGTSEAFDIDCDNEDAVAAAELWFTYDSTIGLDVSDIATTSRTDGWNTDFSLDESDPSAVEVHTLLYNTSGWSIDPGTGAILSVEYDVDAEASGESLLDVTQVNLGDASGQPLPATSQDGTLRIEEGEHKIHLPLVMKRWPPIPDTPVLNPISNPDGDGNYTVSWNTAYLANTYTLQEDDNAVFSSPTTRYTGSRTSWNASGKPAGTYYYRVKASNSWGDSGWSNVHSVGFGPPETPVLNPISNPNGYGSYTVTWNEANLAQTYALQEDDNAAFSSPTTVYSGPDTSKSVTGRDIGTYYYRVRATNSFGSSSWSNVISVQVTHTSTPTPTPTPTATPCSATVYIKNNCPCGLTITGMGPSIYVSANGSWLGTRSPGTYHVTISGICIYTTHRWWTIDCGFNSITLNCS